MTLLPQRCRTGLLIVGCLLGTVVAVAQPDGQQPGPEAPRKPAGARGFSVTVEGPVDDKAAPVVGRFVTLFYECYPKLLDRFEHPERPASRAVRLVFRRPLRVPAFRDGNTITISLDWIEQHPEDIGLLTHELTHIVQDYPQYEPGWLTEGIADYARHLYGPAKQPGWMLPERLRKDQSYKNSYGVTAKFLVWLEARTPGVVDQLHRRMQDGKFELGDFETLCGKEVDALWDECIESFQD